MHHEVNDADQHLSDRIENGIGVMITEGRTEDKGAREVQGGL